MENTDDVEYKLDNDEDFIAIKRFGYSLTKLLVRYPDGVPPRIAAQALAMNEAEAEGLYQSAVLKLRELMRA